MKKKKTSAEALGAYSYTACSGLAGGKLQLVVTTDLFPEALLVVEELAQACAHALEVGDVVADLLDGLHLLLQVVTLQEVRHLQ